MIHTLQLVTTRRPFFEQQVAALEQHDVHCDVVTVPKPPSGVRSLRDYMRFYGRVLREALDGPYDIVHANYGLTAPAAIAQPTRPIVLSLWGSDVWGKYGYVSDWCSREFDAVIVMSEQMADELETESVVIPHGVDMDLFEPLPQDEAQAELGWDDQQQHILFPYSTTREVKDFPRATRIVEAAQERLGRPLTLQTVSGEPHERIPVYMSAADAMILTSRWEGSPNAVKEALACNLPVVSTDVGDVREYLHERSGSFVGRSDEELVTALCEVLERRERPNSRDAMAQYSLDQMAKDIVSVYRQVLKSKQEVTAS
ncbi:MULTISPECIES: glycosyltransferase family 4 protein [Haloferax]|uniref:Glycosyltransferase n=2 Tax=Haloferax TaxID=2251 RepID=A0A6G1Z7K9_9EURY|nr:MULTISPECIES: glycosyltransferase family 4 protein [Haloferax]KAB1185117.1 glycosyltransferase family 4 protein [Haloferax sp. CBA1149]MRW82294.1 glycosyltransferase [Haloferax marinisediminis]